MTIASLLSKIFKANQTPNNTVNWSGVNGLKSIQEDLVDTIRQRTFFTVPTTADLLNQGFSNAVLCYVQDHAFFRWQAQGIPNGTTIFPAIDGGVWVQETIGDTDGTVTSIGLSMPAAFTVTNSPVTTSGVIGVTAAGTSAQYIKGDGTLGTLPTPTGGTVTNVSALTLNTSGTDLSSTVANPTTTPVITLSVPTASAVNRGVLSPTDWTTFNNKQNSITLTTTGTSGAATLVGSTLNIPQYQSVLTNPVTGTGTTNYLSKWTSSSTLNTSQVYDNGTNVGIGTTTPEGKLQINGSVTASSAIARSTYITSTLTAAANNDVLVGLDINPTFTNGAYTGLTNLSLRVNGYTRLIGSDSAGGRMIDVRNSSNNDCFYVRGYGDAYIWQTLYLGTLNGSSYISSGNLSMYSGVGTGSAFINFIHNNGNVAFKVLSNSVIQMNPSAGNVLIGTTTDAGYKLDVIGDSRIKGSGSTSGTTTFRVENSSGGSPFTILGDGTVNMGFNANLTYNMSARGYGSNGAYGAVGVYLYSQNYGNAAGTAATIAYTGSPAGVTSNGLVIGGVALQSATYNALAVNQSYTGLGTNTLVGYLFDPTLDATFPAANIISIKTTKGNVLFGTTSGSVGIGANTSINASAILDITSTTKGFLPPRMTDTQILAIASPANGLMVYSTTQNVVAFYDGTGWKKVVHINL